MSTDAGGGTEHASRLERVVFGLLVMTVGVLLLLDRATALEITPSIRWGPPIVIALGLARFLSPGIGKDGRPRSRAGGVWVLYVGLWGLANVYGLFGLHYSTSWPLLLVGGGLSIVWDAFAGRSGSCRATTTEDVRS